MTQVAERGSAAGPSRTLLAQLCDGCSPRDFAVRYWAGSSDGPDAGHDARFTLVLKHAGSLRQMLWPFNKAAVGEAYIYDDIDIEGDIMAFFELMFRWRNKKFSAMQKLGLMRQLLAMPNESRRSGAISAQLDGQRRSEDRDRQAVQYHYDGVSSEFYRLFLDRRMQYSCGYFANPGDDIHAAQENKLDHICRKLRLKPGERLLDFGGGGGGVVSRVAVNEVAPA